ncbi:Uncharacterized protein APZ42_021466 [Daphnia magna]|uniref:Uncharacterized protein n=1 Tax=Daphnia magna TaxID=35525 RepID=A0A164WMW2_9CRUS|nr:Uncharacterized protein APZ42_021466 [Daphnia magna]
MEGKRRIAPDSHFRSGMPRTWPELSAIWSKNPISIAATAFSEYAEAYGDMLRKKEAGCECVSFQPSHISPSDGLAMPIIARLIEFYLKATLFSHC